MKADRINGALKIILRDDRARLFGTPDWGRDEAPELYDAIILLRAMIVKARIISDGDDAEIFGIGSSYIRYLFSWLTSGSEAEYFYRSKSAEEIRALEVIKARGAC